MSYPTKDYILRSSMATIQSSPQQQHRVDPSITAAADQARANRLADSRKEGPTVSVTKGVLEMAADMAEELGFLQAELRGTDEAEAEADEGFEDLVQELIRESLAAQGSAPEQKRDDAAHLRDQVIQMQLAGRPGKELDDALRRYTGGSSQKGLALLAELAEMAKTDPRLAALGFGPALLEDYALAHEAGLTAALNIATALQTAALAEPDSAQRILNLYEESIASSQSVLQTFQRLGQAEGISTVADWRKYLTEAVAADLSKQTSGGEKVQLQLILLELKGFRTFNTLTQGLERMGKMLPKGLGPPPAELMQSTLDYVEQPLREMPKFESMARDLKIGAQILFFQGMRNLLKSLPDDAYTSPEQKSGTLIPFQKRVDDLTWTEEV